MREVLVCQWNYGHTKQDASPMITLGSIRTLSFREHLFQFIMMNIFPRLQTVEFRKDAGPFKSRKTAILYLSSRKH